MENASEEMAGVKIQHLRLPKTDEDDDSEEHRGVHRVCVLQGVYYQNGKSRKRGPKGAERQKKKLK